MKKRRRQLTYSPRLVGKIVGDERNGNTKKWGKKIE